MPTFPLNVGISGFTFAANGLTCSNCWHAPVTASGKGWFITCSHVLKFTFHSRSRRIAFAQGSKTGFTFHKPQKKVFGTGSLLRTCDAKLNSRKRWCHSCLSHSFTLCYVSISSSCPQKQQVEIQLVLTVNKTRLGLGLFQHVETIWWLIIYNETFMTREPLVYTTARRAVQKKKKKRKKERKKEKHLD